MTFVVKSRGDRSATIVCVYTCPEHGEFDAEVHRDESGSAPDVVPCGAEMSNNNQGAIDVGMVAKTPAHREAEETAAVALPAQGPPSFCELRATWTPSPVMGRVRRVEVVRGKYEKPERKTFLDTRKLGEGQDPEEFRAERRRMWRDVRMDRARKEFLNK